MSVITCSIDEVKVFSYHKTKGVKKQADENPDVCDYMD